MRISDWSSDVCSSDLVTPGAEIIGQVVAGLHRRRRDAGVGPDRQSPRAFDVALDPARQRHEPARPIGLRKRALAPARIAARTVGNDPDLEQRRLRSEEHTSELQSLMRTSYAVFCLKKKTKQNKHSIRQYYT